MGAPSRVVFERGVPGTEGTRLVKSSDPHYSMLIRWSIEDELYLVVLPDWERERRVGGPVSHGGAYEEAARNGHEALEALIGWATDKGYPLPRPLATVAA